MRRWVLAGVVAVAVAGGVPALSGPAVASEGGGSLHPLVRSASDRVALSDDVASAKWATGKPIDDPEREQRVLDNAGRRAVGLGLDPAEVQGIFRDQIEASKLVQRGWHHHWTVHREDQPKQPPDLGRTRPEIDRLNGEILAQLRGTEVVRTAPGCDGRVHGAYWRVRVEQHLDALHANGLARALPSMCQR